MAQMIAGTNYARVTSYANRYVVFSVDLSDAHPAPDEDVNLGLQDILDANDVPHATALVILSVPSAFQFMLNSIANTAIDAQVGMRWENFEITEIYYTNTVIGAVQAKIEVEYRVD